MGPSTGAVGASVPRERPCKPFAARRRGTVAVYMCVCMRVCVRVRVCLCVCVYVRDICAIVLIFGVMKRVYAFLSEQ